MNWIWELFRVTSRGRFSASFKFSTRGRMERRGRGGWIRSGRSRIRLVMRSSPTWGCQFAWFIALCPFQPPVNWLHPWITLLSISLRQRESRSIVFTLRIDLEEWNLTIVIKKIFRFINFRNVNNEFIDKILKYLNICLCQK